MNSKKKESNIMKKDEEGKELEIKKSIKKKVRFREREEVKYYEKEKKEWYKSSEESSSDEEDWSRY
jgi:hypothetical protein